jgi:hypothetical protein
MASLAKSPAAMLRQLMNGAFNLDELKALCFDLNVDFDTLSGSDKSSKIIELIQWSARNGRIVDLIDVCRKMRPNLDWNEVGVAAASNPGVFSFVPVEKAQPLFNATSGRAARLGFGAGIVAALGLMCSFSGGLMASRFIDVTINPVQPDSRTLQRVPFRVQADASTQDFTPDQVGQSFQQVIEEVSTGRLPSGTTTQFALSNVQATTYVDQIVSAAPDAPITDFHARFLPSEEGTLNFRLKALNNLQVVVGYTAKIVDRKIIAEPVRAAVKLFGAQDSRFGWIALPTFAVQPFTDWANAQLADATKYVWFDDVKITDNRLAIQMTKR